MLTVLARPLARLYPWPVDASAELDRSVAVLGWSIDVETVVRAGYGAGVVLALVGSPAVVLSPDRLRIAVSLLVVGLALGVVHAVHRGPVVLALARRKAALGQAPDLVTLVALRMRLTPAPEVGAAFAVDAGEGPLVDALGEHVRRAIGTPRSGLVEFADEWGDWHPSLRRSILLLEAAADAPTGRRGRLLSRASRNVLDGTRRELARFAGEVRGPTTALYAFGVLLPLALVAILPAAGAAGVPLSLPAVVAIYDLALPATLVGAAGWLLVRRPVAFPPRRVPREHPDVPDDHWPAVAVGLVGGGIAWIALSWLGLPYWARVVVPLGIAPGLSLVTWYRPHVAVRDRTRAIEADLPSALSLLGRRIEEGHAAEVAIGRTADEVAGPMGDRLAAAADLTRRLGVTVEEAFLGPHGALATVPSVRARSAASLLALAATEGPPAGTAVLAVADHLDELLDVERAARCDLATVVDTMESTATLFGPGVAGATLALSERLTRVDAVESTAGVPAVDGFGVAIGVYVLLLSAVLAGLAAGLQYGFDRSLVGHRVGRALLAATVVYPATFLGASLLV